MYFKRLELNGFKSFANPVTIEFNEGITCVVGPNGSGKSNVSDAIRWVLGEQSPKLLRGGKMEDVIFSGTQSRKAKGMAEVTLVIDNSDRTLDIDFAEVGITRRVYRSGESEYMINRIPCRLRDIRELIMDTGIGVEGYSVIGQGKIADIVSNKMDSRREIFEEAAGIVKYRSKREETERKLQASSDNLERVNDIAGEIESRIDALKSDSEKAEEYLQIRDKYRYNEINIIVKNIDAARIRLEAANEELSELGGILESSLKARAELEAALRDARSREQSADEKLGCLNEDISKLSEEIYALENREELNKERFAGLERDRLRIEAELSSIVEKLEKEEENFRAVEASKLDVAKEEEEARRKALEKKAAAEKVHEELMKAERELSEQKELMLVLSGEISSAKAEISGLESIKSTLSRRLERLSDSDSASESERIAAGIKDLEVRLCDARKEKDSLDEASQELEKHRDKLSGELSENAALIEDGRVAGGKISARLKLLEELEKAYEGYSGAVRFVMQAGLPGIIGTVGDLLQVPDGWELAIETALGGRIQNIVCERDEDAKRAIELLKKKQAGRVTFLPVKSLRPSEAADTSALAGIDGYLGLASENVTCEGAYDDVVKYLLGRVAVCRDLDSALAMSGKVPGLRLVTLAGERIDPAGAITGGSFKSEAGNLISRKNEKEKLGTEFDNIQAELQLALKRRDEIIGQFKVAESRGSELVEALRAAETRIAVLQKEEEQLRAAGSDAENAWNLKLAEIVELKKEIDNTSEGVSAALKQVENAKQASAAAEERAAKVAEGLEELRACSDEARQEETAARLEQTGATVKAESARQLEERVLASIEELKSDISSRRLALIDIENRKDGIAQSDQDASGNLEGVRARKIAKEEELASLAEEKRSAHKLAQELDERRGEFESRTYEHQLKKHDADLRLARAEAQTETLRDKLWEEFEISHAQALDMADPDFVMSKGMRESREYRDRMREIGDVNIGAIEEYKSVKERFEFLSEQKADLEQAIAELSALIVEIDDTIQRRFSGSFEAVAENFETTFSELFGGGHARLSLEDPSDPLNSAIEIEAQPPGKKLQNMNLLSGGEKTMTAIALMFAVLKTKPTPFCILDEVEAALDETNLDCFARYLDNFGQTQFVLITHQKSTMEHADVLYGVTMPEQGISELLSLRLGDDFDI